MSNRKAKQARQEARKSGTEKQKTVAFRTVNRGEFYPRWDKVNGLWFVTVFTPHGVVGTTSEAENIIQIFISGYRAGITASESILDSVRFVNGIGELNSTFGQPRPMSSAEQRVWDTLPEPSRAEVELALTLHWVREFQKRLACGQDADTPIGEVVDARMYNDYQVTDDETDIVRKRKEARQ